MTATITLKLFFQYLGYLLTCLIHLQQPADYETWFYEEWSVNQDDEDPFADYDLPSDHRINYQWFDDDEECDKYDETNWEFIDGYDSDGLPDFTLDALEWAERYPDLVDDDFDEDALSYGP